MTEDEMLALDGQLGLALDVQLRLGQIIRGLRRQRDLLLAAAKDYVAWSEGSGPGTAGTALLDALRAAIAEAERKPEVSE
jgi:hypothetical protein